MSRSSSKYYCDYCDCYLVSQSIAVRKQHNNGAKHKANCKAYYLQFLQEATQKSIDQTVRYALETNVSSDPLHVYI
jgi:U1 small nuclear ribonucleoprotein C